MSTSKDKPRKPALFRADDPALTIDERPLAAPESDLPGEAGTPALASDVTAAGASGTESAGRARRLSRVFHWGGILLAAAGGLVTLAASLAVTALIEDLFARAPWLGWLALALAGIAALALVMILARELVAIFRLSRITRLHDAAARAHARGELEAARRVCEDLARLYAGRRDLQWARARIGEQQDAVFDADDLLALAERELFRDLDARAANEIAASARRVSVVTAVSPAALIDIGFVLAANIGLLRRLAALYGGRPGLFGLLRLARAVLGHLAVTGGMALGDSLLQQVLGHGLAARLSARLGEGVINGLFTARIGLAALQVCRPLPFFALKAPALKQVMSGIAGMGRSDDGRN